MNMNAITTTSTSTTSTTTTASTEMGFVALAVLKGKGTTTLQKANSHIGNGAHIGALVAQGIARKAIVDDMASAGMALTIHALSVGNIRPAMALVIARWGKAYSMLTEGGKAPYSEWRRLGAILAQEPRYTKAGKLTPAGKAHVLFRELSAASAAVREGREQAKISA
jgi:hypothetical protein